MTASSEAPRVLILAGKRSGTLDPLARKTGVSHKCLVRVRGEALIGHVLRRMEEALPDAPLHVSIEDASLIMAEPTVARLHGAGRLQFAEAQFNLVDSVAAAARTTGFPLLVTTADNVLLTNEAVAAAVARAGQGDADSIIVLARKGDIEAAHPDGKGRYYEFRDGGFSNCNLFWLGNSRALHAAEAFREGGQFLKVRGRMMRAFGAFNALRYKMGLFTLAQMLRAVSRRRGARIVGLVLGDGRLAIDVDDEKSHRMVEEIMAREAVSPARPPA